MREKRMTGKMISLMARQSLKTNRMRNIFVSITIVLASALLAAILMFAFGQHKATERELSHAQQVGYYNLTEEQMETLKADERIAFQIQVKTGVLTQLDDCSVLPYYVSEMSDKIRVGEMDRGRLPREADEIALQEELLKRMEVTPEIGSKVTIPFYDGNTETFTVSGIVKGGENAKQFPVFFSEKYARSGSQLKNQPYEVYAKLYGAADMHPDDLREAMYLIGSDAGVERAYVSPSRAYFDSRSVSSQDVLVYGLVGGVILLACVLVIYGVFYLSVIGRIRQFGQLRTIGMTKKQMRRFVSREGSLLFVRAAPAGVLIGLVAGYFMVPAGFSIVNTLIIAVLVLAVIYLITMISVRKPAKIAGNVSPMEALRYVPEDGMKKTSAKRLCRNLTPVGLGVMNFSRNRKKAAITMLSLGLGGILFMTAATYISSYDREGYARQGNFKNAEFDIGYSPSAIELDENGLSGLQAKSPIDQKLVGQIRSLDGVTQVEEKGSFGVIYDFPEQDEYNNDDLVYPLTEEETENIGDYLEEGSVDYDKLSDGSQVLVADNGNVEEIYGWKFSVGDRITFHYFDGTQMTERQVEIGGILKDTFVRDHDDLEGWFVMPARAIMGWISYDSITTHLLVTTDPDREEKVGEALEEIVSQRPDLYLDSLADRRVAYNQSANQVFAAISGLAAFIMVFSILSMMNTLITNIVTRKQELAMLESIGMDKRQIRRMLLGESLLLVVATVGVTMTVGTLCGYVLCRMLYQMGAFYMAFRFPVSFALIYGVILLAVPLLITAACMSSFSKEALVERLRGVEC